MQLERTDITLKDFYPINRWKIDNDGPEYDYADGPKNLIDQTTKRNYRNEDLSTVWCKCALLTLGTPLVHSAALVIGITIRIARLITFFDFWKDAPEKEQYDFTARLLDAGGNLLKIIFSPLIFIALEFSAIYGLIRPYDGRKLYASFERLQYGSFILAPCFQPDCDIHLFGGDPKRKNSW